MDGVGARSGDSASPTYRVAGGPEAAADLCGEQLRSNLTIEEAAAALRRDAPPDPAMLDAIATRHGLQPTDEHR